jgi:ferredoxin-NADP reductase/nitrite reductase/ring-hydroxylating ferredoxin subunit
MTAYSTSAWYPIAAEIELPFRHVFHAMLLGREFAVWRADDDTVNVWENRCLHRGVRLSIGINEGAEIKCQYHGWRYANRTAACTYIPAHPANAPARTIRNRTYRVRRAYGLVWSGVDPVEEFPRFPSLETAEPLPMRAMPVNASAAQTLAGLCSLDGARQADPLCCETADALYLIQPISTNRSIIRGLLKRDVAQADRLPTLRRYNEILNALRDRIEATAVAMPEEAIEIPRSLPAEPIPGGTVTARPAAHRVRVARKWSPAAEIAAFRLETIGTGLPDFEAGAHIDVHLPNGLIRQYSLTNGPGDNAAYVIGVKREPASTGGSSALHDIVREGDVLAISDPHNNFRLARGAKETLLVAGGIGITPLLAMARSLAHSTRNFHLHYFVRSPQHAAFREDLASFAGRFTVYEGLEAAATQSRLAALLAARPDGGHVYVCGPAPMLEAVRSIAEQAGWPEDSVHFEYFKNARTIDSSSAFEVALARSAMTLRVPGGKTIVEVLRENGVFVPTSCEQGACGTCMTTVLDGVPDHQDVFLSKAEQASGACMMPCVSRAKSARLVLDL